MRSFFTLTFILSLGLVHAQELQLSHFTCPDSTNSFRGLSAVNDQSAWFSSNQGQVWYFEVAKGWDNRSPKGYENIQWRDIEAFNDSAALILSAGSPGLVLRTEDAGRTWTETYRDDDPKIFFDAMDFWDDKRGVAFADAQGLFLGMIETEDGGRSWIKKDSTFLALLVWENQGGFAASGSCIHCIGEEGWAIVLGGQQANLIVHETSHLGYSSTMIELDYGEPSKGAFSIDFKTNDTLIVVGGDYRADSLTEKSVVVSYDAGKSWQVPDIPRELKARYWSCVSWEGQRIILCSRFGTAISSDNGKSWEVFPEGFYSTDKNWFSGPDGRVARL